MTRSSSSNYRSAKRPGHAGAEPGPGSVRALVTNDDGLDSGGLKVLIEAAVRCGLDVTVAVPSWDSSGAGASLTAVSAWGRVLVERVEGARADGVVVQCVHAPPAFIVRAAMFGAFGPPPDVVLSGVNKGVNTGRAVIHSGTVGAALTAATLGRRALAMSADVGPGEPKWEAAGFVASSAIGWLLDLGHTTVLNVNVPDRPVSEIRGIRSARLAPLGVVQSTVTEVETGFVPVTFGDVEAAPVEGTDASIVNEGYVSVTAVSPICEDRDVPVLDMVSRGAYREE